VTTRVTAFAKVTLSLRILGRRPDGYHELDALVVSATEPHDSLILRSAPQMSLRVSGPFADDVPTDDSNLAWRAARALDATLAIELAKGVPAGAGLGGGSADAAAVLAAVGNGSDTTAIAAELGSDVRVCLHGGPARMRGRGEIIEPIAEIPALPLVIIAPEFGCATAAVYRAWDELGAPRSRREIPAPRGYPGPFVNDLEAAAEQLEPRLRAFRETAEDVIGTPLLMCGSGSAFVAWFDDAAAADDAALRAADAISERVWRSDAIVKSSSRR
jgi:4-diphosphocytidyl-2-C-methyl-D-erythritol kinase